MQDDLIEINDAGHQDLYPFFFCASILVKEDPNMLPHLKHVRVKDGFVYGTNGVTMRRARLHERYKNGLYRVMKKTKKWVILYLTTENDYPETDELFDLNGIGGPVAQVIIDEYFWNGHAVITAALKGKEAFNPEFLKNAQGAYDLFVKGRQITLDNEDFAMVIMPIQKQESLPFDQEQPAE